MDKCSLIPLLLLAPLFVLLPLIEADVEQSFLVLLVTTFSAGSLLLLLRQELRINPLVFRAVLLFGIVLLISTALSPVLNNSALAFLTWMAVLMTFLSVTILALDAQNRQWLVGFFLAGGVLTIILSFYYYFGSSVPLASRYLHGVFHDSSSMGGLLVLIVPLTLSLALQRQKTWSKALLMVLSCVLLTALILTRARSAWVAGVIGTLIVLMPLLVFQVRQKSLASVFRAPWVWTVVVVVVMSFLSLMTVSSPALLLGRAESLLSISDPTASAQAQEIIPYDTGLIHRLSLWRNSWRMVLDQPLFGVGPGNFGRIYHQYQGQAWIFATDAHNTYLNVASEVGLLGLFGLLLLLGAVFWQSRTSLWSSLTKPHENLLTLGLLGGVIGLLAHSLVDYSFSTVTTQVYFFTFLGLLSVGSFKVGLKPRRVVSAVILAFLALSLVLYFAVVEYQKGELALAQGDGDVAGRHFQTSLNLNPTQAYVYETLGLNALNQKNPDLAVLFLQTSIAHDPTISEVYGELAIAYYTQGDLVKTEQYLKLAIEKGPYTTPRYFNALAKFYLDQGDSTKALETYELALSRFPLNDVWKTYQHLYKGMNDELVELYVSASQLLAEKGDQTGSEELIQQLQEGFRPTL